MGLRCKGEIPYNLQVSSWIGNQVNFQGTALVLQGVRLLYVSWIQFGHFDHFGTDVSTYFLAEVAHHRLNVVDDISRLLV